jgi:hypothetical protein
MHIFEIKSYIKILSYYKNKIGFIIYEASLGNEGAAG